jgi:polyketide cyclase/dehydrase/lipid transport protein
MVKVYVSSVIDAPVGRVWAHIRDFNALPRWVPVVVDSRIEGGLPADQIGCVRNFNLNDGGNLREQLLALSDHDHSFTYNILVSPMGVQNYVATLKLTRITDGDRTFTEWTAEFDCEAGRAQELTNEIGNDVFQAAFDNLKRQLAAK